MPTGTDVDAAASPAGRTRPGPRAVLVLAVLGATAAVLLGLTAATRALVAADGTLAAPSRTVALGILATTTLGLAGLTRLFLSNRRHGACGSDRC
jgi:hypothetical protein